MRVLITGGAGYIGYALVKRLLNYSNEIHSISIYDNLSRKNYSFFTEAKFDHKPVRFIEGDILDGRTLKKAVDNADCVVHLAAKVTTPFADTEAHQFDQINHWGTAQLASVLEYSDVSKVVYLSSISAYGASDIPVSEDTVPNPHSFYGISKLAGEEQLNRIKNLKDITILRSGNVYGYNPAYRIDAVINRFMFMANFVGRVSINGSGEQYRSFIHVDKIAYAIHKAIDGEVPAGIFNVAEHNLKINEVSKVVKEIYPELETIHVNHNIKLRDVSTSLPLKISDHITLPNTSLNEELMDFRNQFSF
jgi:UDP-glucose 4-epimerase